jgi:hypothetical protein
VGGNKTVSALPNSFKSFYFISRAIIFRTGINIDCLCVELGYFCSKCGSRILHAHIVDNGDPPVVAVKGGVLDGLDFKGALHIFCRSAVVPIPEGVKRWEAEPDFSAKDDDGK